ncbi:MAG TPA: ZIP family metal transporter [Candidatus Paceibacterota bacterium]|nr:ZIP family metal transporter [Candidatus Paceibacterota bacterium]
MPYLNAFFSVTIVSLVSFIGVLFLFLKDETLKKYIHSFIGLAIGALLGDAFIHLIPEAFEKITNQTIIGILLISGILMFFILERFMHWHHHGEDSGETEIHPVGKLILFTDGFHNLIDGIIIGVSFLISTPIGIATTIAVILHEIPQEVGDFAVLIHSGFSKRKALYLNFISALMAVVGLVIAFIFGSVAQTFTDWVVPIAAGGFIYIAMSDLIPELKESKKLRNIFSQIFSILLGIALMLALLLLE